MGRVDRVYVYLMFASLWYRLSDNGFWPALLTGFLAAIMLVGLNLGLWKERQ